MRLNIEGHILSGQARPFHRGHSVLTGLRLLRFQSLLLLALIGGATTSAAFAQTDSLKVTIADGGSVTTSLIGNIKVNKNSSLKRTWITINDSVCPVQMTGAGISTVYERSSLGSSGDYRFNAAGSITASEAVSAVDITFILYDPFGTHMRTLGGTYVQDFVVNSTTSLNSLGGSWYATENDISELLTVVAFISHVRTVSGAVWHLNSKGISAELSKIQLQAASSILEPDKLPRK